MNRRYHLIGIGGIGMSGIAHLLLGDGCVVSGSDVKETKITQALRAMGATVIIGHAAANIEGAEVVVYSSAVKEDNPELAAARQRSLAVLKRGQALAGLMHGKTVVTVTGSHGKTTTASLAGFLLLEAGLSPTVAVGGILKNIGHNAARGKGDFFVAEADESDGSFLYYEPTYSIITNIDREHLDYYTTFEKAVEAYAAFMDKTTDGGLLICSGDDPVIMRVLAKKKQRRLLFGLTDAADIYPADIRFEGLSSDFDCYYKKKMLRRLHLDLGGTHNVSNALAVVALGLELGIGLDIIAHALAHYQGSGRRLDMKFNSPAYTVLDDYAHHPTEIRATLRAVRHLNKRRVIAVFQPHRYSRTRLLLDDFGACFTDADQVVLTDIYPAGECAIAGVTAQAVAAKIKEHSPEKPVAVVPKEGLAGHVAGILEAGDAVLMLGAGDIVRVSDELVERLKERQARTAAKASDHV